MNPSQLIAETINYYKTHPRAIEPNGSAKYITNHGHLCAVGRCLQNPSFANTAWPIGVMFLDANTIDIHLKAQYKGQKAFLWHHLQKLHDMDCNWIPNQLGGNDLSPIGQTYISKIINPLIA